MTISFNDSNRILKPVQNKADGRRLLIQDVHPAVAKIFEDNIGSLLGYSVFVVKKETKREDIINQRNNGPINTLFIFCDDYFVPGEITTTSDEVFLPKATIKRISLSYRDCANDWSV